MRTQIKGLSGAAWWFVKLTGFFIFYLLSQQQNANSRNMAFTLYTAGELRAPNEVYSNKAT